MTPIHFAAAAVVAALCLALGLLRRGTAGPPRVRARPRRLPWVHATIRVTREAWRNWSGELACRPRRLYCDDAGGPWRSPRTLDDLRAIVRDARAEGARVRVFGSSHSWARLAPCDDGYMVDNRMIGAEGSFYALRVEPASADGARRARVTTPPGLLSGELERWLWDMGYTLPTSAVEDCFTIGGMVATATHGSGIDVGTLSDHVVGMTFVDGLGEVRRWTRESATGDELGAIQCGLGCLGLVYDVTLEVEARAEVIFAARSVPYASLFADTDEARAALRELHTRHAWVEYFWWPFRFRGLPVVSRPEINPEVWVITLDREVPADVRPRGALARFWHGRVLDLGAMVTCGMLMTVQQRVPRLAVALPWLACYTNLWVSARSGTWRVPYFEGQHFVNATGVEFVRALAAEWSVPFEHRAPVDAPEGYERVRRSFATLHDACVDSFARYPLSDPRASPVILSVEMRVIAPSEALLAPGYQPPERREAVRYAAPEIVTTALHPAWEAFLHETNLAFTTRPEVFGAEVRCHHAKPFHQVAHPGFPEGGMGAYLRAQYEAAGTWRRFLAVRRAVDPDGVFLNDYLRAWFREDRAATASPERRAEAA